LRYHRTDSMNSDWFKRNWVLLEKEGGAKRCLPSESRRYTMSHCHTGRKQFRMKNRKSRDASRLNPGDTSSHNTKFVLNKRCPCLSDSTKFVLKKCWKVSAFPPLILQNLLPRSRQLYAILREFRHVVETTMVHGRGMLTAKTAHPSIFHTENGMVRQP